MRIDARTVAFNIRKYRQLFQMTQEELARKVGYRGKSSISRIEKGLQDTLTIRQVRDIAGAIGVPVEALCDSSGEEARKDWVMRFVPYLYEADDITLEIIERILQMEHEDAPPKNSLKDIYT